MFNYKSKKEKLKIAYSNGKHSITKNIFSNPYDIDKAPDEFMAWEAGYNDAINQLEIARHESLFNYESPKCSG